MEVECGNRHEGCEQMIQRNGINEHEELLCEYRAVKCIVCKEGMIFNDLQDHQSNVYGCMDLKECANKCTIQQYIDSDIKNGYYDALQPMLHKLTSSTYAPIVNQELHNK